MRIPIPLFAAALAAGCGSAADERAPGSAQQTGAGTGVTVELPLEAAQESAAPDPAPAPEAEAPETTAPTPEVAPEPKEKAEPEAEKEKAPPPEEAEAADEPEEKSTSGGRPPLSDALIARTIERIGYACGKVVGSDRVEGAGEPVFKINCSSGESYRGTTKQGKLFFRPWSAGPSNR